MIETIVRIIFTRDNQVLLCKNKKQGHYFLPGGHVEFGDSFTRTIYKEMDEELGLKENEIGDIAFKGYVENQFEWKGETRHEINMVFSANLLTSRELQSLEDHISFEWIPLSKIGEVQILPKEILKFVDSRNS